MESKLGTFYGRWGWSDDDILSAFRRYPQCMIHLGEEGNGSNGSFSEQSWDGRQERLPISCGPKLEFLKRRLVPRKYPQLLNVYQGKVEFQDV
ncbi:hypothetical protein L3X38_010227 [Prunus dulcis]|uniref:Uncharacterized protein n=1 Tax=Prunus dulcis TaxID=3755 RepID=A0AAD4ZD39_PRUDU|nr:hypothetical protein L3X38_010227 [Prunus dulcis]